MDRKYSDPNIWDNSIDCDDAPDGSDGGYTKNGSYIRPPAMRELVRLRAELAEAKKFKDGMLDVLGGACPNDHRSTPFEEFKGCTPCLRDELAALQQMYTAQGLTIKRQQDELAELRRFRKAIMDYDSNLYDALANSDTARKGEGE